MAKIEKKDAPQEGFQRKLYTGVALMQVVMINPSLEELVEEGYVNQKSVDEEKVKEPVYMESDGRFRIEFYFESVSPFKGETIRARHSIYVGNAYHTNKEEKYVYINSQGSFLGADKFEKLSESDQYEYREAKVGEIQMAELLRAWCNVKKGEELPILHWKELSEGNLNSLVSVATGPKSGFLKVLLGVKTTDEGKRYQAVYGKKFERHYTKDYSYLHKDMVSSAEYSSSVIDYGVSMLSYNPKDFDLKEFSPVTLSDSVRTGESGGAQDQKQAAPPVPAGEDEGDDDLPF